MRITQLYAEPKSCADSSKQCGELTGLYPLFRDSRSKGHTREEMRVKRTSCIATAQQVQFIYYYGTNNYKYFSNTTCAINNLITQYGVISASIGFYPILSETNNRTTDDEYFLSSSTRF